MHFFYKFWILDTLLEILRYIMTARNGRCLRTVFVAVDLNTLLLYSSTNFARHARPSVSLFLHPLWSQGDLINYPYEILRIGERKRERERGRLSTWWERRKNLPHNIRHVYFDKEHCHLLLVRLSPVKSGSRPFYRLIPSFFSCQQLVWFSSPCWRHSRFMRNAK